MVHAIPVPEPDTVRVSLGVARVKVPSVAWIAKLNVAAVALPSVTTNGAPALVGVTVVGKTLHVGGAPAVHDSVTFPAYPSIDVRVPFQLTF